MGLGLHDRLLRRELGGCTRYSKVRGLYGDQTWVDGLDIVNELDGHTGCVNALSWSKSGNLLASGSDDTRVHIHSYLPESSVSQFNLTTSIVTGHTQNIFSVKFMPHSNDRTVVSAAGDATVRVFDLEHSGHSARRTESGRTGVWATTQRLSEGDTNARVFRSHSDRVKRIVTESSPFYFLTCSEDGEVRQWDVREPESSYPMHPRRYFSGHSPPESNDVPPPLISYKRYSIDLNSISCSPSRPHYIALGGNHLHCFLHDRRMLGRDRAAERGSIAAEMDQATQCVRRFAPHGQPRMGRTNTGHITACKISDADPNELIASWSADHIYSFNIHHPDDEARYSSFAASKPSERKRKRVKADSSLNLEAAQRGQSKARKAGPDVSLRVNFGNGQREEIPVEPAAQLEEDGPRTNAPDFQQMSYRIAKGTVRIRRSLFSPEASSQQGLSKYTASFSRALTDASSMLPEAEDIMRTWRYPVNPPPAAVAFHQKLRRDREASTRFIQAAGTLSRVLGGKIRTVGGANADAAKLEMFLQVRPAPNEASFEHFCYDFLKAICLWLDSGPGGLVRGFAKSGGKSTRFPLKLNAGIDAIESQLIPYLLAMATTRPILNLEASPYEVDDNRIAFDSETLAVLTFAEALKIPFEDLGGEGQDRQAAINFWGFKVGRGVLMNAAEGVNFHLVDTCFGGLGQPENDIKADERLLARLCQQISDDEDATTFQEVSLVHRSNNTDGESESDAQVIEEETALPLEVLAALRRNTGSQVDSDSEELASDVGDALEGDSSADEEEGSDGESDSGSDSDSRIVYRARRLKNLRRSRVNTHVPVSSHSQVYQGHCNVKTVKDVNFYGLQDEYVVSGSDSGHLFIWDRKSTKLINILEGDGEVVNVAQGHPYEPLLAVSGIDHTIKIFSADARARRDARLGVGVRKVDESEFSSIQGIGLGRRRRRTRAADLPTEPESQAEAERHAWAVNDSQSEEEDGAGGGPPVASGGLPSKKSMWDEYRIKSANDADRQGGGRGQYISQSMMNMLLGRLREQFEEDGSPGTDGEGGPGRRTLVIDEERCATM